MAITVNGFVGETYRMDAGQTDGNEIIYKLNSASTYIVDCIVTSAGTASLKGMTGTTVPADFSGMSVANDGTQTVNFSRTVSGWSRVGLDIASGTWTVRVRRVS